MYRHVKMVSATASGDYYQLTFDDRDIEQEQTAQPEQCGPYVLLQRQFEMADDGACYVESDDENYIGHYRLKLIELAPNRLAFEIDRVMQSRVEISFALASAQFKEVLPIAEVIFGLREPQCDDDAHALSTRYASQNHFQALALRGIGFALIELQRLDEAESTFQESLKIDPANKLAPSELAYRGDLPAKRK